jgi:hypothetical protein
MTKKVRIENADTSNYSVIVETWQKNGDADAVLVKSVSLSNPADLTEALLHSGHYLVIREVSQTK